MSEKTALEALAAEFVRYWTTDRTPDGCGLCGGIPHSTTCYVGRMATMLGSGTQSLSDSEPVAAQERSAKHAPSHFVPSLPSADGSIAQAKKAVVADWSAAAQYAHSAWSERRLPQFVGLVDALILLCQSEAQQEIARITSERDAFKRDFNAELDGNAAIRKMFGARDDESFFAFIQRLAAAESLAAERQQEIERLQAIQETLAKHAEGLIGYVVDNGSLHEDDCSCDDTCYCSEKPKNDAANAICKLAEAAESSLSRLQKERVGGDDAHGGRDDRGPADRLELPHAEKTRQDWLALAAWMRAPGTIDREDAIDSCARAVENYAEYQFKVQVELPPAPETP